MTAAWQAAIPYISVSLQYFTHHFTRKSGRLG